MTKSESWLKVYSRTEKFMFNVISGLISGSIVAIYLEGISFANLTENIWNFNPRTFIDSQVLLLVILIPFFYIVVMILSFIIDRFDPRNAETTDDSNTYHRSGGINYENITWGAKIDDSANVRILVNEEGVESVSNVILDLEMEKSDTRGED